ncbi:MAG: hypothetical protein AB8B48_20710, partial [Pseudomonadales bacterium]
MKHSLSVLAGLSLVAISACGENADLAATPSPMADTVVFNATIHTMNSAEPTASAVAIKNGKSVYVGNHTDSKNMICPSTKSIELPQTLPTSRIHAM